MRYRYKYSARHKEIIDAAINRGWTKSWCVENGIYVEAHHIFPIAEYPEWERASWNIVLLLPEEHYEIHRELALSNPDCDSANHAWWMMCTTTADAQGKREYEVSSEDYGEARRIHVEYFSGENNPGYIDGRSSNPDYNKERYKKQIEKNPDYNKEQYKKRIEDNPDYNKEYKKQRQQHFINGDIEFKPDSKYNPVRRVGHNEEFFSAVDAAWDLRILKAYFDGRNIIGCCNGKTKTCGNYGWEYVPLEEQLGEQWYIDNGCKWCEDVSLI